MAAAASAADGLAVPAGSYGKPCQMGRKWMRRLPADRGGETEENSYGRIEKGACA